MPERPGPWDLLDRPSDPVVADTAAIDSRLAHFRSMADAMRVEGQRLARIGSGEALAGKYADELRSASRDVAKDLSQVVGRYDAVVQALVAYQPAVDAALTGSAGALDDAINASGAQRQADALPLAATVPGAELTPQQLQANDDKASATTAAAGRLRDAKARLAGVLATLDDAGRQAAATIRNSFGDGLTDSGWDRFKYAFKKFLKILVKVLTYIGMALAVIAILIPGVGPLIFAAGAAIAGVALAAEVGLMALGEGSWLDLGMAIVGLLTLGGAKLFGPAIKSGFRSAMGSIRGLRGAGAGAVDDAGGSITALSGRADDAAESVRSSAGSIASRAADDVAGSSRGSVGSVGSRGADDVADAAQETGEEALTKYLGGGAHDLNSYLRGARAGTDEALEARAKLISSHLNSLPPVDDQIRTFRGVIGDFTKDLKRGDIFVDKAFMSTSKDKNVVDEFIASGGQLNGKNTEGVGTKFVIDSEGTGRDVDKFTGLSEREVLFDRNTPFEVTGISTSGNTMRVNGEVIDVKTIYMKTPGMETD